MTKQELIEKAKGYDIEVDESMTKAEIQKLIEEAELVPESSETVEENEEKVNNKKESNSKYGAGKTFEPAKL